MKATSLDLPAWAIVSDKRRAHIERVVLLLDAWATSLALPPTERAEWLDAGRLHDALRDADESTLRALTGDHVRPSEMLHGPAAATRLAAE